MTHHIKIQKEYADAVASGDKAFEVRYNDRGYQRGDHVIFQVMDGGFQEYHPLNSKEYEITYVLSGFHIEENYVVFAIKECDTDS